MDAGVLHGTASRAASSAASTEKGDYGMRFEVFAKVSAGAGDWARDQPRLGPREYALRDISERARIP
jgi:hypothetical protein